MHSLNRIAVVASFALLALAGCATVVPKELADARIAYNRARLGPAAQQVPAELHKARESLAQAEQAFLDKPEAQSTRDFAYVAERKSQLAEAMAIQSLEKNKKGVADQQFQKDSDQINNDNKGKLIQTREQLAASQRLGDQQAAQIGQEQQARMDAESRRADAERRMKEMQENLAKYAAVKEEERGLVITLSGSVLFQSDQSTLLPEAQTRLDQVGAALMATKERNLIVEGHTDSKGSESHNLDLSQRRAEAVRTYLVGRGYESTRIAAHGIGKGRPIANNANAEGRANNRRVEIVIEPKKAGE